MATVTAPLSIERFAEEYDPERFEYWYGEAIDRPMPTYLHGLMQAILIVLLDRAGFVPASEVELRIDPQARPRPDIVASRISIAEDYPTRPLDLAIEILSDDRLAHLKNRCRKFQEWGFGAIYVVDPRDRTICEWLRDALVPVSQLAGIAQETIWTELDRRLARFDNVSEPRP